MNVRTLVFGGVCAAACCAFADKVYFEAADGYWRDQSNWSSGGLPGESDTACFTNKSAQAVRITTGDSFKISSISICRNNNNGGNTVKVVQDGGALSSGTMQMAVWPLDNGYYYLSGGLLTLTANEPIMVGGRGLGVFEMTGGSLQLGGGWPRISGWAGKAAMSVRGGTATVADSCYSFGISTKENGRGILNVGGTGRLVCDCSLTAALDVSDPTSSLNLLSGGILAAKALNNAKSAKSYYQFAGGVLEPADQTDLRSAGFVDNVNVYSSCGGLRVNPKGKVLTVKPEIRQGNVCRANLHRRWSFTGGSLVDSIAGVTASTVGTGIVLEDGAVTLPGSNASGVNYVALESGSGIFPDDCSQGVTLEFWATVNEIRNYQSLFGIKDGNNNLWETLNKGVADGSKLNQGQLTFGGANYFVDNPTAGWDRGALLHFSVVLSKKSDGTWLLTFNRYDANGLCFRTQSSSSIPATFDPAQAFGGESAVFKLGSGLASGVDAAMTVTEVRVWKRALTDLELSTSAAMGPDADLDADTGLETTGPGVLVVKGGNTYAGKTKVTSGALSLGAEPVRPLHRWSFNGDLTDSCGAFNSLGQKNATKVGSNAEAIVFDEGNRFITLPGGNNGTAYLKLVSAYGGLIPESDWADGLTFEFWARENEVRSWARIFEFHHNYSWYQFMCWTAGTNVNQDYIQFDKGTSTLVKSGVFSPYATGVWYHIAVVTTPDGNGAWKVTFHLHNADTGAFVKSYEMTPLDGWTPEAFRLGDFTLAKSNSGDNDPAASYDEVRVWDRALTKEQLDRCVAMGPDVLPAFGTASDDAPGALPSGTGLEIAEGAAFLLSGAAQTVAGISGLGQVVGPGALTVTDAIEPGANGVGSLNVTGGLRISGTVRFSPRSDGSCNSLVFGPDETYDVSGLALALKDGTALAEGKTYVLIDAAGATLTGTPDVSGLGDVKVRMENGRLSVRKNRGIIILFR